jgi:hypothetical protein
MSGILWGTWLNLTLSNFTAIGMRNAPCSMMSNWNCDHSKICAIGLLTG